jgi:hypothetical protein
MQVVHTAKRQLDGHLIMVNEIPYQHTCITSSQRVSTITSQLWVAEKIASILSKTPNTNAKKLNVDLEKQ